MEGEGNTAGGIECGMLQLSHATVGLRKYSMISGRAVDGTDQI
jgi:hypothetical protein